MKPIDLPQFNPAEEVLDGPVSKISLLKAVDIPASASVVVTVDQSLDIGLSAWQSATQLATSPPLWQSDPAMPLGYTHEDNLLASCYQSALSLAEAKGVKKLYIPLLSVNTSEFPVERAAKIAFGHVHGHLRQSHMHVCFYFDKVENLGIMKAIIQQRKQWMTGRKR